MIEIPESKTVARQVRETLAGHTVTDVFNATHPHKFTWYSGDPLEYRKLLTGRRIVGAEGYGAFVDISLDDDVHLLLSDGVNLRLYASEAGIPAKYQLLVTLDDERFLVFTVAMYGGILAFRGDFENPYYRVRRRNIHRSMRSSTPDISGACWPVRSRISRQRLSWPRSNAFRDSGTGCCRTFFSGQASIPNANSPHWTKRMPNGFSER
jgi:hypothetical protein